MCIVIVPTRVTLNIPTLETYITDAKVMQISSPTFFLLIVASQPPSPFRGAALKFVLLHYYVIMSSAGQNLILKVLIKYVEPCDF